MNLHEVDFYTMQLVVQLQAVGLSHIEYLHHMSDESNP